MYALDDSVNIDKCLCKHPPTNSSIVDAYEFKGDKFNLYVYRPNRIQIITTQICDSSETTNSSSDIITILIGINDIGLIMNTDRTPFQQRNMLFSFYKCYADLITILAKSNSRIILMEPFLFPWPACYRTWLPFRQKISQMIHQLSEQFQIPYLTLHEELNEKARRYGYSEITTDGIHLTEQGQKFLADRLYKLICGYSPY